MVTFVQQGDAVDYTPDEDVTAGSVVVLGGLVGITKLDIAADVMGALALRGVYDADKADGVTFDIGDPVYWDVADGNANASSGGNTLLGPAVAAAASDDTKVRFLLRQ